MMIYMINKNPNVTANSGNSCNSVILVIKNILIAIQATSGMIAPTKTEGKSLARKRFLQ